MMALQCVSFLLRTPKKTARRKQFPPARPWPQGRSPPCCCLAREYCRAWSCLWCWPRQTSGQDVPGQVSLGSSALIMFVFPTESCHSLSPAVTAPQKECKYVNVLYVFACEQSKTPMFFKKHCEFLGILLRLDEGMVLTPQYTETNTIFMM